MTELRPQAYWWACMFFEKCYHQQTNLNELKAARHVRLERYWLRTPSK